MYKNLCFKGGGTLGIAYIGALKVLWDTVKDADRIAGTSAGAILATLFAVGYTPDDLYSIMSALDFSSFLDRTNIIEETGEILSSRHGLHSGNFFQHWIEKLISDKTRVAFTTFRDLHELDFPDLSVPVTYLNEGDTIICNYQSTPDVIVSEAVRASMSIPLIFDRFEFTRGFNQGQAFVDGGEMLNYPISLFNGYPEEDTLGFYLHDVCNTQPPIVLDSIFNFARAHFEAIAASGNSEFFNNARYQRQSIIVDSLGLSATNFNLSALDKERLYQSGIQSAGKKAA